MDPVYAAAFIGIAVMVLIGLANIGILVYNLYRDRYERII